MKPQLPTLTIPDKFVGDWGKTIPASYGVLKSPPIVVKDNDWTNLIHSYTPQFSTSLGQQIGNKFIFFGTYVGAPGAKAGDKTCGYLGDPMLSPADQLNEAHKLGVPGPMLYASNVTAPENWKTIQGQPLEPLDPPTNAVNTVSIRAQIEKLLDEAGVH
jgi:hypothetical protein